MKGYKTTIESLTLANTTFRTVLYTGKHSQLVLMNVKPLEEIGEEVHTDSDQFFRFEQGTGHVVIDGVSQDVATGDAVIVPAGAKHNIVNTSQTTDLKLYTIYSPPHHADKTLHTTKQQAQSDTEHFDGKTSE